MDYMRSCYSTIMDISQDQRVPPQPVTWYFAPPGAKLINLETAFVSSNWDMFPVGVGAVLGENYTAPRTYYKGFNKWGYSGQCHVGTALEYAEGITLAKYINPPKKLPQCCISDLPCLVYLAPGNPPPVPGMPYTSVQNYPPPYAPAPPGALLFSPVKAKYWTHWAAATPAGQPFVDPGVLQLFTNHLNAITIPPGNWSCGLAWATSIYGLATVQLVATLKIVDGISKQVRATIFNLQPIGSPATATRHVRTAYSVFVLNQVVLNAADILLLEVGVSISNVGGAGATVYVNLENAGQNLFFKDGISITSPATFLSYCPPGPPGPNYVQSQLQLAFSPNARITVTASRRERTRRTNRANANTNTTANTQGGSGMSVRPGMTLVGGPVATPVTPVQMQGGAVITTNGARVGGSVVTVRGQAVSRAAARRLGRGVVGMRSHSGGDWLPGHFPGVGMGLQAIASMIVGAARIGPVRMGLAPGVSGSTPFAFEALVQLGKQPGAEEADHAALIATVQAALSAENSSSTPPDFAEQVHLSLLPSAAVFVPGGTIPDACGSCAPHVCPKTWKLVVSGITGNYPYCPDGPLFNGEWFLKYRGGCLWTTDEYYEGICSDPLGVPAPFWSFALSTGPYLFTASYELQQILTSFSCSGGYPYGAFNTDAIWDMHLAFGMMTPA